MKAIENVKGGKDPLAKEMRTYGFFVFENKESIPANILSRSSRQNEWDI
ncbi:MAG: hypothetical protein ACE5K3_00820 [bacterium]